MPDEGWLSLFVNEGLYIKILLVKKYFMSLRKNAYFPEQYMSILIIKAQTEGRKSRPNVQILWAFH